MAELRIGADWMASASGDPEVAATAALLGISVDGVSLTRNEDIWAKTVRDNVFVSAYPLAMWFASSWWRLNFEPLPRQQPSHDWRMAHEAAAANHGFVWPRIIFTPDGEAMQVWAGPCMTPDQSVQYLQGLDAPRMVALNSFQQSIQRFVQSVLYRLDARELKDTNLKHLWAILQEDLAEPDAFRRRKLEAELGFDPEGCPEGMLEAALEWENRVGDAALSELAPAIASSGHSPDLTSLTQLSQANGIIGSPQVTSSDLTHLEQGAPWERAAHDAQALRRRLGNIHEPLPSRQLHELLGLSHATLNNWSAPIERSPVAVAVPTNNHQLKFVPRKRKPDAQRFELARFLGEYLRPARRAGEWLASTDLSTSRQKYQRAFAAELLCPLDSLLAFLDGDFSSYAIAEAAEEFEVSDLLVSSHLLNNGLIRHSWEHQLPYAMAA